MAGAVTSNQSRQSTYTTVDWRYKARAAALAILGYTVIFGLLASLIALLTGVLALAFYKSAAILFLLKSKILFVLLPAIWLLCQALWIRFERPAGHPISRVDTPLLFAELDSLRSELRTPKIHQVLLTPDFNASMTQTPRLGVFGWHHNTLTLGMDLLLTLPAEQARAVIAHELGHLSANHSRFSGWIYRVRLAWERLMYGLADRQAIASRLLAKFFHWYAPLFSRCTFDLARQNEFEADAIAAKLTAPHTIAQALLNTQTECTWQQQHYWEPLYQTAEQTPEPPARVYRGLQQFIATRIAADDERSDIAAQALREQSDAYDTHPSLPERLAALGVPPQRPGRQASSAAAVWFADNIDQLINEFDQRWRADVNEPWRERFEYVGESKETLSDLERRQISDLSDEELFQRIALTAEFGDPASALTLLDEHQKRQPGHPEAALVRGQILADQGDDKCLEQFQTSAAWLPLSLESCERAYVYLCQANRPDEAAQWIDLADQKSADIAIAEDEIQNLRLRDELSAVDREDPALNKLTEILNHHPRVKAAWLAKKVTQHEPQTTIYAISYKARGFLPTNTKWQKALLTQLEPAIDSPFWLIPMNGDDKPLGKKIKKCGTRVV